MELTSVDRAAAQGSSARDDASLLGADVELASLAESYRTQAPFPSIRIDGFLDPAFALEVAGSFPSYEEALKMGRSFSALNEKRKVAIANPEHFPEPVQRLSALLGSADFIAELEALTGIEGLLYDEQFYGGGLHMTAASGWLDVHVDFNLLIDSGLHRRLNLLLYLNEKWDPAWGGAVEFWNADVTQCVQVHQPELNRAVIFSTSQTSFHGVTPVVCPPHVVRKSFAVYYYTREAPPNWDGKFHDTTFRARPAEHEKKKWMPAVQLKRAIGEQFQNARFRVTRSRH